VSGPYNTDRSPVCQANSAPAHHRGPPWRWSCAAPWCGMGSTQFPYALFCRYNPQSDFVCV